MTAEQYASPRDEVLHMVAVSGWGQRSSGHKHSPSGWYVSVINPPEDMGVVGQAFEEDIDRAGLPDTRQLLGHFVVTEGADDLVHIQELPTEAAAVAAFDTKDRIFCEWLRKIVEG